MTTLFHSDQFQLLCVLGPMTERPIIQPLIEPFYQKYLRMLRDDIAEVAKIVDNHEAIYSAAVTPRMLNV